MKGGVAPHLALFVLLCVATGAQGQQDSSPIRLSGSGFITLVAGQAFGGDPVQDSNGYKAPLYVADYAQAGIYEADLLTVRPDSRIGLQGSMHFGTNTSITGQIVSRGAHGGNVNLEWLYASHNLSDKLTLQIGRKRLPLFYYSETQDVGFTYPWVHLPPQPYGWEIVNYNGINVLYRDQWGDWASSLNFFGGNERRDDNPFWKIYNGARPKLIPNGTRFWVRIFQSTAIGLSCGALTSNPIFRTDLKTRQSPRPIVTRRQPVKRFTRSPWPSITKTGCCAMSTCTSTETPSEKLISLSCSVLVTALENCCRC
jgi:hypothetical protein